MTDDAVTRINIWVKVSPRAGGNMIDETEVGEAGKAGILGTNVSRRKVIAGAGVAGATLWVAPVIDSFVNRAAAGSLPSWVPGAPAAAVTASAEPRWAATA